MEINKNEVHIWLIDLNSIKNYNQYNDFLGENECLQAKNLSSKKLKKNHIIAHYATRDILSNYLDIPLEQIPISYTKFHKPYLKENPAQIEFNLTHSHDIALLAITKDCIIGIDIEEITPLQNQSDIEKIVLSEKEFRWLSQKAEHEKCESFYRFWTAKEALIKGIGEGFQYGFKNIEFEMPQDFSDRIGLYIHSHPQESRNWTIHNFKIQEKHMGALATKQPISLFSHLQWEGPE